MKQFILTTLILLLQVNNFAQDSSMVFSYDAFIKQVMTEHPYAFRANIVATMGETQLKEARGGFDPKLSGDANQKYYKGDQYYSHLNGGLTIPTWFGLSAKTGYKLNDGIYLNPEQQLPDAGLWYAGLQLELGQGLIMNERRAEFEKAKLYEKSSELERTIMLNKLRRDASFAYWQWQQNYEELNVYKQALTNATQRLEGVKNAAKYGDKPYIDTIEASIKAQYWQNALLKSQTYFENAELKLEIYLWDKGFAPLEINGMTPDIKHVTQQYPPRKQFDSLITNHPYLKMNELKIEQQKIDLKLKKEYLKPKISLKYNAISESIDGNPLATQSMDNYTWGASFSYPLLSRKERSSVQLAKLKIQDQELKNQMLLAEIEYKIKSAVNKYRLSIDQLDLSRLLVTNSEKMYDAEQSLFQIGESSVFMINSRESSWLKAQVELIRIENECRMLKAELLFQLMLKDL